MYDIWSMKLGGAPRVPKGDARRTTPQPPGR